MQKTVLGQTEFTTELPTRETVVTIFETTKDFAGAIESQNIPYVVWQDTKQELCYMLIPTTGWVCKVEFEASATEEAAGYEFYLGFADGLSSISLDQYKGTECFFGKEVDCYVPRVVENEKAA